MGSQFLCSVHSSAKSLLGIHLKQLYNTHTHTHRVTVHSYHNRRIWQFFQNQCSVLGSQCTLYIIHLWVKKLDIPTITDNLSSPCTVQPMTYTNNGHIGVEMYGQYIGRGRTVCPL